MAHEPHCLASPHDDVRLFVIDVLKLLDECMITAQIPACKIAGLPAERYYILVVCLVSRDQLGMEFFDLEQIPGIYFYQWLNDVAALADLHTRFVQQDGWYESAVDRWNAIRTLSRIACMYDKLDKLNGQIYTAEQVQRLKNGRAKAAKI